MGSSVRHETLPPLPDPIQRDPPPPPQPSPTTRPDLLPPRSDLPTRQSRQVGPGRLPNASGQVVTTRFQLCLHLVLSNAARSTYFQILFNCGEDHKNTGLYLFSHVTFGVTLSFVAFVLAATSAVAYLGVSCSTAMQSTCPFRFRSNTT